MFVLCQDDPKVGLLNYDKEPTKIELKLLGYNLEELPSQFLEVVTSSEWLNLE
jgi:hypothetical protein